MREHNRLNENDPNSFLLAINSILTSVSALASSLVVMSVPEEEIKGVAWNLRQEIEDAKKILGRYRDLRRKLGGPDMERLNAILEFVDEHFDCKEAAPDNPANAGPSPEKTVSTAMEDLSPQERECLYATLEVVDAHFRRKEELTQFPTAEAD